MPRLAKSRIRSDGQGVQIINLGHFRQITELPGHGTVTQSRKIFRWCARACKWTKQTRQTRHHQHDQRIPLTPYNVNSQPSSVLADSHTLVAPFELRGSPRSHHCKGKGSLPLFRSTTQHLGTPPFARRRSPISIRTSLDALFTPPMSDHPSLTSQPSLDTLNRPPPRNWATEVRIHITRHVGVGLICAVAYFDPCVSFPAASPLCRQGSSIEFNYRGNWSVDLQAGSDFGYKLLFVILLAGLFAVVVQVYFFTAFSHCQAILISLVKRVWHVNSAW